MVATSDASADQPYDISLKRAALAGYRLADLLRRMLCPGNAH